MSEYVEILIVEDSPDDLELAMIAFERAHVANHIEVAHDGEVALDFIFARGRYEGRSLDDGPGVILLDLKLPKVDGLEVLAQIKGDARTRNIPVVVLTSSQEESDRMESYRLGVNSYIVKPVDFVSFVEAVKSVGYYWALLNEPPILKEARVR